MISCQHATELMTTRELRPLTLFEMISLRMHTAICSACSTFEKQIASIKSAIMNEPDSVPGSEFINALERAIKERRL
ncbi:MAG: zf-HC2 domain-containing protein [Candidatus Kapabacteria bacterium]|nr:zf-HC2 domain-containing protein [Candidatus Kapabacteria bacterium]